ncbi:MAG: protein arginine kinase [bacterium]
METIRKLIKNTGRWLDGTGDFNDVVISSRIRLARNLSNIPYTWIAGDTDLRRVMSLVQSMILGNRAIGDLLFIDLYSGVSQEDRTLLMERNLISQEHASKRGARGVAVSPDETISIMINEEDHIRLQVMMPGLQLKEAWRIIDRIDDILESGLEFAFSEKWGYLTACPTNTGTGLRASVFIHLPSLGILKQTNKIMQMISAMGFAARGIHGEGSESLGHLYQISNQTTLGQSEEEIIDKVSEVATLIADHERNARGILLRDIKSEISNRVLSSYEALKQRKRLSTNEALELLSDVRLGVVMSLIEGVDLREINKLMIYVQPTHLQYLLGKSMSIPERDVRRAIYIREELRFQ